MERRVSKQLRGEALRSSGAWSGTPGTFWNFLAFVSLNAFLFNFLSEFERYISSPSSEGV